MRVLVVSEGKHEQSGALQNLLKRLGGHHHLFEHDRIASTDLPRVHKGKGYFKKALRWVLQAQSNGYDALIFLIDEDGITKRVQEIRQAQDHNSLSCLPRAMGVAIRTFDAWMLADEQVLTKILGYNVNRQTNPEAIRNPKQLCATLLAKSQKAMSQSQMYASLSREIDIDILCDRCQSGFKPFAMRVRNIFQ